MTGSNKSYRRILELVSEYGNIDYDELIADEDRDVLLQLSSLRHSLLSWYPFPKEAEALEINAGCGALSALLLDRFDRVDLFEEHDAAREILKKRFPDMTGRVLETLEEVDRKYDFVFALDLPAFYQGKLAQVLEDAHDLLKEGGILCVGFRNRNASKYSCGSVDDIVREPFKTDSLLSLSEFNNAAGSMFENIEVYCPFPDALYTQAVYRSGCMPTSSFADRVRAFDPYNSPLIKDENEEFYYAIKDGTLLEKSDFYLVFLSKRPLSCPIERVILSPDRGEHSFMTIFEKDRVYKKAINAKGSSYLEESVRNADKLRERGIDVVPQSFEDKKLIMPYVHQKASLDEIADAAAAGDDTRILRVFDQIYKDVCRSSETAGEPDPEVWGTEDDSSPVLKEAMIDMIPYNAFLTENGLCYYDQEFVWENTPANYVMFRAVRYTSIHLGPLFDPWRDLLLARYGISETLYEIYLKKENAFVDRNRRRDLYHQFYDWTYISPERIKNNRQMLMHSDEDEELQKIHAIQLTLLKKFDAFCKENDLKYFALHGTLLGTIRHQGFIPWDDDIDLGMTREDYDKLVELYVNRPGIPYLQSMGREGRIFHGGYAKYRDENSVAVEERNRYIYGHKGVSIDIMPLDRCPEDPAERKKLQKKITEIQRCIYARCYSKPAGLFDDLPANKMLKYYLFGSHIPLRFQYPVLNHLFRSVKDSSLRTILACYYGEVENRNLFREKDLNDLVLMPFEDTMIPVPRNYHQWLLQRYGENYLYPPKIKNRKHSNLFIKLDDSYKLKKGDE